MDNHVLSRKVFLRKSLFLLCLLPFRSIFSSQLNKKIKAMNKTGIVTDQKYIDHILEPGHPESPQRLKAIYKKLNESAIKANLISIAPAQKTDPYIKMIHPESHIKLVQQQAKDEKICLLAVSGVLSAVDAVCTGKVKNAFCAIRPPGHHATDSGEYGFCFYNNVAIAAKYAQQKNILNQESSQF